MQIPRRQDVMVKIHENEVAAVNAAIENLAKLLSKTVSLPVIVEEDQMGPTHLIRAKVEARIAEAGWSILREKNAQGDIISNKYFIR